jgi:hypothetical protein
LLLISANFVLLIAPCACSETHTSELAGKVNSVSSAFRVSCPAFSNAY